MNDDQSGPVLGIILFTEWELEHCQQTSIDPSLLLSFRRNRAFGTRGPAVCMEGNAND